MKFKFLGIGISRTANDGYEVRLTVGEEPVPGVGRFYETLPPVEQIVPELLAHYTRKAL